MKMTKNEKRDSGGSSDLEDKLNFFMDDSVEFVETGRSSSAKSTSLSSVGTAGSGSGSCGAQSVSSDKNGFSQGIGVPVVGVLDRERVKSFEGKGWPFTRSQQCTPEKLALAGFQYLESYQPAAKCVFCGLVLEGLRGHTDPWQIHETKKPTCAYVQLGKRNNPGEYSYSETLKLYLHAKLRAMADLYVAAEVDCSEFLTELGAEGK